MTARNSSNVVALRLYKNLLRAAKHFTSPSPDARVLNCLLSRTGIDDHISDWQSFISTASSHRSSKEDFGSKKKEELIPPKKTPQRLFRRLLREVVCAGDVDGIAKCSWPSLVDPTVLWNVVRREFRDGSASQSIHFSDDDRRQVAFMTLRELNKKLSFFDYLKSNSPDILPYQKSRHVSSLPFEPTSYLRPGAFLLAHPNMSDSYFSKTVICLLEHDDENKVDNDSAMKRALGLPGQQTYGLVINRPSVHNDTGKNRTLHEAFEEHMLPEKIADVFGDAVVRNGGPVHVSLQMIHSLPSAPIEPDSQETLGGRLIPEIPECEETSTAMYSDRATYFQGDIFKAINSVKEGSIDRDDVAFFVGASVWHIGQLRNEVSQGFWIPCRGPPEIALTGICDHEMPSKSSKRPLADLWLSMMSACGEEEAKLAHLFYHQDGLSEHGLPCDAFEDEDVGL